MAIATSAWACIITLQATRSDGAQINTSFSETLVLEEGTPRLQVMNDLAEKALRQSNLPVHTTPFSIKFFYMDTATV